MTKATRVHSTPPTNTSVTCRAALGIIHSENLFPPGAVSLDSLLPQPAHHQRPNEGPTGGSPRPVDCIASLRLTGPERELLAALLGYVAWGLEYGKTLQEMEAAALLELERAHQSAEKSRRQALRRSQLNIVAAAKRHGRLRALANRRGISGANERGRSAINFWRRCGSHEARKQNETRSVSRARSNLALAFGRGL
jgi:hypothetical protein